MNLPVTSLDADSVDDIPLLGFVTDPPSLVGPSGLRAPMNGRKLAELPIPHPSEEPENVALFLAPELLDILVGSHHRTEMFSAACVVKPKAFRHLNQNGLSQ